MVDDLEVVVHQIHLIDGTFELFRAYYSFPKVKNSEGKEIGAVLGLVSNTLRLCKQKGVTHLAAAFDHVIESFRNQLFPGYKTGEGIDPDLYQQFHVAEKAIRALGIVVWPMVEFEADDAIATAAHRFSSGADVSKVVICSPDKDFAQLVQSKIVLWDRIRNQMYDSQGVVEKFGVAPGSIPDWLALVGDTSDGIPGLPRFGAKTASALLSKYPHLEDIPGNIEQWEVDIRGKEGLNKTLRSRWQDVLLFRKLATLRLDVPITEQIGDLFWKGVNRDLIGALGREIPWTLLDDEMLNIPDSR